MQWKDWKLLPFRCISCNVYLRSDSFLWGLAMLAYLDSLCAALLARNTEEIRRLLAHPLAQDLPRRVREEAVAISRAGRRSFMAPVNALHLYYKLTHMVDETSDPSFTPPEDKGASASDAGQIELPLRKVGNR